MEKALYRVWAILEDGSRAPILSRSGSWLLTEEEVAGSPFVENLKAGNPMKMGRDKNSAFMGPRDMWVELGGSPDDFVLIVDVKVEEATLESQSHLPYTGQAIVHNFVQGLVGIVTPGWPNIVFDYKAWEEYVKQFNERAKDIEVERELHGIREAADGKALVDDIQQFLEEPRQREKTEEKGMDEQ